MICISVSGEKIYPAAIAFSNNTTQNNNSLTLQVVSLYPQNGMILTNFPTSLKVQVTRGGYPVEGATIQFWFGEHNAYLTTSDASGLAYLTLLNQNTLTSGYYSWHATAIKTGFRGASTSSSYFIISPSNNNNLLSEGTIYTDKTKYYVGHDDVVKIFGNVNGYYLGDAIILKIISHSKTTQLVARGTYLGAFQINYNLEDAPEEGIYTITAFYKYNKFSTTTFTVVEPN